MSPPIGEEAFTLARNLMVQEQIESRGVRDKRVLDALGIVPRHRFVPESLRAEAYGDHPLPIGPGQTISQPYIVAAMASALELRGTERVLEVGSGCGYTAAVLSRLAREVYGLELAHALVDPSRRLMEALGFNNVHLHQGDGNLGWPQAAPFDAILLSCAASDIPEALWAQLVEGGRLLLPLGAPTGTQSLTLATKREGHACRRVLERVAFVPLVRP